MNTIPTVGSAPARMASIQPLERRMLLSYTFNPFTGFRTANWGNFSPYSWFDAALMATLDDQKVLVVGTMSNADLPGDQRQLVMAQFNGTVKKVTDMEVDFIRGAQARRDGSLVVLGEIDQTFFVARYKSDGTRDNSFSGDGIFELPLQSMLSGGETFTAGAVEWAADGKAIVVGSVSLAGAQTKLLLARLTSAGALDATFDGDGWAVVSESTASPTDVQVLADGKLLLAGRGTGGSFLRRFSANGAVDTTFGDNGVATFPDFGIASFDVLSDGKILVTAGVQSIARLTAGGALDGNFGDNGLATMLTGVRVDSGAQFHYGAGGTITVLSTTGTTRFTADGQLDPLYGIRRQIETWFINDLPGPYLGVAGTPAEVVALTDNQDILVSGHSPSGEIPLVTLTYVEDEDVSFDPSTGRLSVSGTNDADTIVVEPIGDQVRVTRNGEQRLFPLAQVQLIDIASSGGDDNILVSLAVPASISGGSGDDTIVTGGAADTINAADGSDSIASGGGADHIVTGDGDDTVLSGDGDDDIFAISGNNVIDAGAGNDVIRAPGGNNSILGGAGDDRISAGPGNDTIRGGPGADRLFAGDGNNLVYGGEGDDCIKTGAGRDTLWGEIGYDSIKSGEGDDLINGGAGKDHIWGQQGNDRIYGRRGNDAIDGGPGDDRLVGDEGRDKLFGRGGNDVLFAAHFDPDRLDGGAGFDTAFRDELLDELLGVEEALP